MKYSKVLKRKKAKTGKYSLLFIKKNDVTIEKRLFVERIKMAGISFPYEQLINLIEHHISLIQRFEKNKEDMFSIIFLKTDESKKKGLEEVVGKILRTTDIITKYDNNYIIFLPLTDYEGAYKLLRELQDFLDIKKEECIVSYPEDGDNAHELLYRLKDLVKRYYDKEIATPII